MNFREQFKAILTFKERGRMPIMHFGYWKETLQAWVDQGHLKPEEIIGTADCNEVENRISAKLGFDCGFLNCFQDKSGSHTSSLYPPFEQEIVRIRPDGLKEIRNKYGVVELHKDGAQSIHAEVDTLLKDRKSWEEHYKPRLIFSEDRLDYPAMEKLKAENDTREVPLSLFGGSMMGQVRNYIGLENLSYMLIDDPELVAEICDTLGELAYQSCKAILDYGIKFDFIHFWEDISYNHGPLINPAVVRKLTERNYRRVVELGGKYGVEVFSLDSDGQIDQLLDLWLDSGVTTMMPIEVGTWGASIAPWRQKYGEKIKGLGGLNKHCFARGREAVDAEIKRIMPLVELGGYIPMPDHRIAPDAEWDNVRYYTDRFREALIKAGYNA